MNLLEIVMLIIGILIILFSCLIVAHPDKNRTASIDDSELKGLLQENLDTFKQQQNEILTYVSEETLAKTEEYLSRLSNEKIMAVSEYSDQILEKINRNHEEVVFLYNMLNNKENELKETLKEINSSQQKVKDAVRKNSDEKVLSKDIAKPKQPNTLAQNVKLKSALKPGFEAESSSISINNAEILKLHKQDNSVVSIAKQLGIGQGEVKLVIDLFTDR
ncbi:MAG TPA: hypothetical protein GX002_00805 [Clostridiales bacterium]|jgi:hypothetical protein|nr:hypothetical protein [Clostridiales bacterium]